MNNPLSLQARSLKACVAAAVLLALPAAHAANLARADYDATKSQLGATYKIDKAACGSLAANAKDICVEVAKAKDKVARADLEYRYTGKPADMTRLMVVKAETNYAVAKEKCDDLAGNVKDVCRKEAKAVEVKALADAKMGQQIGAAKVDAAAEKRDADYAVAIQKCDAMAGDAKASCVAAAKAAYGKS